MVAGDRNEVIKDEWTDDDGRWRSPFAVAEDRNGKKAGAGLAVLLELAAAVRGGRGSQHPVRVDGYLLGDRWRPSSGMAEDRNLYARFKVTPVAGGGHPPRWPRIATSSGSAASSWSR